MLKPRSTFDEVSATDYFAIINQDCNRNEMQKLGGPPLPREEKREILRSICANVLKSLTYQ